MDTSGIMSIILDPIKIINRCWTKNIIIAIQLNSFHYQYTFDPLIIFILSLFNDLMSNLDNSTNQKDSRGQVADFLIPLSKEKP